MRHKMKKLLTAIAIFAGFPLQAVTVQEMGWFYDTKTPEEFEAYEEYVRFKWLEAGILAPKHDGNSYTLNDTYRYYWFSGKSKVYKEMLDYLQKD